MQHATTDLPQDNTLAHHHPCESPDVTAPQQRLHQRMKKRESNTRCRLYKTRPDNIFEDSCKNHEMAVRIPGEGGNES